jgi:putative membrane protein
MELAGHTHSHEKEHVHDHRRENMQQWVKVGILFGLSIYFAYNIITGNLANYINERFAWLAYLAVILFGLLGMASFISLRRGDHVHHDCCHTDDRDHADHSHEQIGWGIIAVVAVPLLLGTLVPSRPLGAEAVDNISITPLTFGAANILTKNPLERNVLDWLRVFSQEETPAAFNGEQADVVGFVYREPDFPENTFMVARFTVSCCVADASAIGLPVYWENPADVPDGGWVRVTGAFDAGEFNDQETPILVAQNIDSVEQPEHPYLYP